VNLLVIGLVLAGYIVPVALCARSQCRHEGFFHCLGLVRIPVSAAAIAAACGCALGWCSHLAIRASGIETGSLNPASIAGTVYWLVQAWMFAAVPEELLFRGALANRLVRRLGFAAGNAAQALAFGITHYWSWLYSDADNALVLAAMDIGILFLLGWTCGYANLLLGKSSIWPGIIIHGFANTVLLWVG